MQVTLKHDSNTIITLSNPLSILLMDLSMNSIYFVCVYYLEHSAVQLSQLNAVVTRKWISCGWTEDLRGGIEIPLQISFQFQDLWGPVWLKKNVLHVLTKFKSSWDSCHAATVQWCVDSVGNSGQDDLMWNLPDFSQLWPLHPVGHVHPLKRLQTPPFWHLQLSWQSGPYMSLGQADKRRRNLWRAMCQTERKRGERTLEFPRLRVSQRVPNQPLAQEQP